MGLLHEHHTKLKETNQSKISQGGNVSCQVQRCVCREHVTHDTCKEHKLVKMPLTTTIEFMNCTENICILPANDWLLPVTRNVAAQEPALLHDASGRSVNGRRSSLTARFELLGSCSTGGHFGAIGSGHCVAQKSPPIMSSLTLTLVWAVQYWQSIWNRFLWPSASLREISILETGSRWGSNSSSKRVSADWQFRDIKIKDQDERF